MGATERIAGILLCVLAGVHVFVFAAAFPFFSVVDEQVHFDLIVRYSHGLHDIPRTLTPPTEEALPFIAIYGTPEFLWPPATQPGGEIAPPPWKQPPETVRERLLAKEAAYRAKFKNHEAASPPLYYALAGAWWKLGKALHLDGGPLLYWLRFLNVPLVMALTWVGWMAARTIFFENFFVRMAVPTLIAFLPQTTFYALNNDNLSPLTFGAAFLLLVKFLQSEKPSLRLAAGTGLALAAAFLTKTSNLPLLAVAALFLAGKILSLARRGELSTVMLGLLLVCAAVPAGAWMFWCKKNFGDLTGSALKIHFLGWTSRPAAEWFHHPLFTWDGFWYFLSHNVTSFWQGEQLWQRQPLVDHAVDLTYVALTLGALALALVALSLRPPLFITGQRAPLWFGFLCILASFAFFALLSVKYDFQDCFYPSRAHPFFVSGRLMLGMLVPFLILFVCGLDRLMVRFQNSTKFFLLMGLVAFMVASEITIDWQIFPNAYNWYHL